MEIMTANSLFSVTTRRKKTAPHNGLIETDKLRSFYRAPKSVRLLSRHKHAPRIIPETDQPFAQAAPHAGEKRFHILLIGKEQRERLAMCNALSQHPDFAAAYLEAASGEMALQTVGRTAIELIIFWDSIVDMDCLEFLGRLKQKYGRSKIPVIALLHPGTGKAGVQAMKMGAYAYLPKDSGEQHFALLPILAARIYAKHQVLNALHQTASVSQTITDHIPVAFYRLSLQGSRHDVRISPQILALGFSADQWGNDAELHHRMCHDQDRPIVRKALEHSYKTGTPFQCEYRINTLGDTPHWLHDKANVIMDKHGRPLFLQGAMTDITSRKTVEAELAHYRSMLDHEVCEKSARLERRIAILLESCNTSLGENYHLTHSMYLELLMKTRSREDAAESPAYASLHQ